MKSSAKRHRISNLNLRYLDIFSLLRKSYITKNIIFKILRHIWWVICLPSSLLKWIHQKKKFIMTCTNTFFFTKLPINHSTGISYFHKLSQILKICSQKINKGKTTIIAFWQNLKYIIDFKPLNNSFISADLLYASPLLALWQRECSNFIIIIPNGIFQP